jgi:hypothetical protein
MDTEYTLTDGMSISQVGRWGRHRGPLQTMARPVAAAAALEALVGWVLFARSPLSPCLTPVVAPPLQLPSNEPFAHWSARQYNASLQPGNDCAMAVRNDKYDYFTGNSSSIEGGQAARRRAALTG